MNINLAINEGSKILKRKFITNPLLDAEILMAKTINKDRDYILLNSSNSISKKDLNNCLLYTSPSPRDGRISRMPSSA